MNNLRRINGMTLVAVLALFTMPRAHATEENVDQLVRTALMLDSHPSYGGAVYRNNCANCHGVKGEGSKKGMPTLAGQRVAYLVKQFADFSQKDRDGKTMHKVITSKSLNEPQIWIDLAGYINALPPAKSPEKGDGTLVLLGEGIFREQCASCHEEDARGDDDGFVPSLRNQHYSYLVKQMHAMADGHRRNIDPDLDRFFASIEGDERKAVADYLSRFTGPSKDRLKMRQNGVTTD